MADVKLSTIRQTNHKLVALLEAAQTQEPRSGSADWVSGSKRNMTNVVTFRTEGRNKGSLERFVEANKLGKPVYDALVAAAKYGAHSQGDDSGLLTFKVSPRAMERLEGRLNAIYERRDADGNKRLDAEEQADVKQLDNGKATLKAMTKIKSAKLSGLREELTFSKKVNYVIDLLYSNGSINGANHVQRIADELQADGKDAAATAVLASYHAVSRYMSRGRTNEMGFICQDQRREVQRGLMRIFGASRDATEMAIDALRLPRSYR